MANNPGPGGWGNDNSDSQGHIDTVRIKFTATTDGAVPAFPLEMSNKVLSVEQTVTTGSYDIQFANAEYQSAGFYGDILQASYAKSGACFVRKLAEDSAAGTVTVQFEDGDGDAVDLASGDVVTLVFERQRMKSQ